MPAHFARNHLVHMALPAGHIKNNRRKAPANAWAIRKINTMKKTTLENELMSLPDGTCLLTHKPVNLDAPNREESLVVGRIKVDDDGNRELVTLSILLPKKSDFDPRISDEDANLYYGCDIPCLDCDRALEDLGIEQKNSPNSTWIMDEDDINDLLIIPNL